MDSSSRKALHDLLLADTTFASLATHADRVAHVLSTAMSYEQICTQVEANLANARLAAAKSSVKASGFYEESKLHVTGDKLADALVALRKAVLYTPAKDQKLKIGLFASMAKVHFDMGNYDGALWAVDQAIELSEEGTNDVNEVMDKDSGQIMIEQMLLRANCLRKLHRRKEAIEAIEHLIKSAGTVYGISKKNLNQLKAKKLLKKVKMEFAEPNYASDMQKWRLLQQEVALKEVGGNHRGITGTFYHLDEMRIAIRNSPTFGRHFLATSDIPSETIILQERPFSVAMQPGVLGIKCFACQHDLEYRFYPCNQCINAVYCDRKCASNDWTASHYAFCGGMKEVIMEVGTFPVHLFQMVTRVGGPTNALEIQKNLDGFTIEKYLNTRSMNLDNEKRTIADYRMSSILACHDEKLGLECNVNHTIMALETATALHIAHDIKLDMDFFVPFTAMLVSDLRRIIYNIFGWTEWAVDTYVANCQCLVGSLVNHSCVANTKWEWKDGVINFTTKRAIEKGEEITISYGPNTSQTYYSRQQRLNHYLFACCCSACYTSAITGNSLKCRSCPSGAVVYDSALNKEPLLAGKCITCHVPYKQFNRSIRELNQTKASAKMVSSMSLVLPCDSKNSQLVLLEALKSLANIHKLALAENESTMKATLMAAEVLERCEGQLEEMSLEERLHIVELLDQCLPLVLPDRLLTGNVMRSMAFWFKKSIKWGEELSSAENQDSNSDCTFEPRDALHFVQQFHHRYQEALKSILKPVKDDHLLNEVINQQMQVLDEKLVKYHEAF